MKRTEIREKVCALHEIWNKGDLSAIPDVYADSFIAHMPKGWERSEFRGHSGVVDAILRIRNAFPDWREVVQDLLIDGSRAVTRYVSTGTHTGPFIGLPATGRRVEIGEISIYRFGGGLVVEQWCLTDDLTLAKQLGLIR
jgi:steroid delta-isomerase-like uncharacterized protein